MGGCVDGDEYGPFPPPALVEAWRDWYRRQGISSVLRLDELARKRALRGLFPSEVGR